MRFDVCTERGFKEPQMPDGICNPVHTVLWLGKYARLAQNISDGVANRRASFFKSFELA